jgi:hypothetical protein
MARRDGDVHAMYTIAGRTDAKGCTLKQPDFAQQLATITSFFAFRRRCSAWVWWRTRPTPPCGLTLLPRQQRRSKLGIGGTFNVSPNDGSIMRFGWKAQNKSLLMSAAEAANVEEGVTNDLFPNERDAVPAASFNETPEDSSNILNPNPQSPSFGMPHRHCL